LFIFGIYEIMWVLRGKINLCGFVSGDEGYLYTPVYKSICDIPERNQIKKLPKGSLNLPYKP